MKKSNIILIAFGLFLVGGMLALYVDSIYHIDEKNQEITKNKEVLLPPFSVIVAEKGSDLHIEQSDTNKITIEYFPDIKIPSNLYAVSGDTLYTYSGLRLFVKCRELNAIIGKKHKWIGINDLLTDYLTIRMSGGEMYFNNEMLNAKDSKGKKSPKFVNINIVARDSAYINIYNAYINNLDLQADSASIRTECRINNLNVKLIHKSKLEMLSNAGLFKIEKDSTSQYSAWF